MPKLLRTLALRTVSAVAAPIAWTAERLFPEPAAAGDLAAPRHELAGVAVYEDRTAGGVPVVLVHDVGGAPRDVSVLFDTFRGSRATLAIELPHGRRAVDDAISDLLAEVGARYGVAPDVVAIGCAGAICARVLATTPARARSLAIVAPHAETLVLGSIRTGALDVFEHLSVPVCFVHGDEPRLASAIARLVGKRPGIRRVRIAAAWRRPHVEDGLATSDALRAFFATFERRPELRLIRGGRSIVRGPARVDRSRGRAVRGVLSVKRGTYR
jgi:hypothetical protein